MSDHEEFRVPDGLIETTELFTVAELVTNHIISYHEHIGEDDFDKEFITKFYFIINEIIQDYDNIDKDKLMDYLCDISISFLFIISFILKCYHYSNEDSFIKMIHIMKDKIIPLIQSAEKVVPYWNEEDWG